LATLDYPERLPAIRRGHYRVNRLCRERGVQQIANGPDAIRDLLRDRWRGPQAFMHAAQIVVLESVAASTRQDEAAN
jgi:hypothetical protein